MSVLDSIEGELAAVFPMQPGLGLREGGGGGGHRHDSNGISFWFA